MGAPIHNIRKNYDTGKFWLFDNEFAMYEGAKYMFSIFDTEKFTGVYWHQERILKSLCVFRHETVENIKHLAEMKSPLGYLIEFVRSKEPLYDLLAQQVPTKPFTRDLMESRFHARMKFLI